MYAGPTPDDLCAAEAALDAAAAGTPAGTADPVLRLLAALATDVVDG